MEDKEIKTVVKGYGVVGGVVGVPIVAVEGLRIGNKAHSVIAIWGRGMIQGKECGVVWCGPRGGYGCGWGCGEGCDWGCG